MSSFQVVPAELTAAGGLISSAGSVLTGAETAAAAAQGMAGAFAGEPMQGAFVSACGRASQAILALSSTVSTLAGCVQAAAQGYLVTDHGIIRAGGVPGAVTPNGTGHSLAPAPQLLSPNWSGP